MPVTTAPIRYIRLRPIRSDKWPQNGIVNNDSTEAASTAVSRKSRDTCSGRAVGEHEGGEDVERRLLAHARKAPTE